MVDATVRVGLPALYKREVRTTIFSHIGSNPILTTRLVVSVTSRLTSVLGMELSDGSERRVNSQVAEW